MDGKVLLDTNIAIALMEGERSVVRKTGKAEAVLLPNIAVGELFYGAYHSNQVQKNVRRVEEFTAGNDVISCDFETARHYGEIKALLRRKGRPLPDNDIWIAALAQQHNLTLISRDTHFDEVEGLSVEAW